MTEDLIIKLRAGQATEQDKLEIYKAYCRLATTIATDYKYKVPLKLRDDIFSEAQYALIKAIDEAPNKMYDNNFVKFLRARIKTIIRNFIRKEYKNKIDESIQEDPSKLDFSYNELELNEEIKNIFKTTLERQIIVLLIEGYNNKEIAEILNKSPERISQYRSIIKKKIKSLYANFNKR